MCLEKALRFRMNTGELVGGKQKSKFDEACQCWLRTPGVLRRSTHRPLDIKGLGMSVCHPAGKRFFILNDVEIGGVPRDCDRYQGRRETPVVFGKRHEITIRFNHYRLYRSFCDHLDCKVVYSIVNMHRSSKSPFHPHFTIFIIIPVRY